MIIKFIEFIIYSVILLESIKIDIMIRLIRNSANIAFSYLQKYVWFIAGFFSSLGFITLVAVGMFYLYNDYGKPVNEFYEFSLKNEVKKSLEQTKEYIPSLPSFKIGLYELKGQLIRNLGWFVWVIISLLGLFYGLYLAHKGRKIQKGQWDNEINIYELQLKSHLQERYENSCSMLGNEVMAVRIAGCQALRNLSIDDKDEYKSMKLQCARLLFAFIRSPYLGDDEKKSAHSEYKKEHEKLDDPTTSVPPARLSKSKLLEYVFLSNEILRDDIQEAVDILSFIYQDYGDEELYKEEFELPNYFLKNKHKKPISLIKVNLKEIKCENAHLVDANLRGAKLKEAKLKGADLQHAKLQRAKLRESLLHGADLQHANLRRAKLNRADLQGAKLQHAELQRASLWGADLNGAKLNNADISLTNMQEAKGLTPEQILSAIWGIDKKGKGGPPYLPEELLDDLELDMWSAIPNYDLSEIDEDEDEDEDEDDDEYI